uniref:Exonuclease 1 n=1 Tax=Timema poppense TaxID=170557 RepID=A0A7R9H7G3_TIMPO|nr:unnamed protein product [Timema poppensis]
MGIQGLIPFLEKSSRQVNIRQFSGYTVAIDAYCWLHKGTFSCADKLARGEKCDAYVYYCMKYVNMLLSFNIKPILVFDGRHLPAKASTEKKRRESREICRKRAAELLRAGQPNEARNFLRRAIDVTHEMALALMVECRKKNVDCIVAPYEADAQLAFLNIKNIAQIVITEDSDLVLFGCTRIMFKMDLNGNGLLVEQERLFLAMGLRPENFSFDKFRHMCILSGCDYLPSLPGIGLSKACKFVKKTIEPDIHKALSRLPSYLNMHQLIVSDKYRDAFVRAEATFRYQLVFDPLTRKLVPLTKPPESYSHDDFSGKMLQDNTAYQLALGNLDPFTLQKVADFNPDKVQNLQPVQQTTSWVQQPSVAKHFSIWSQNFRVRPLSPKPDPRKVKHSPTKSKNINCKLEDFKQKRSCNDTNENIDDTNNIDLKKMYISTEEPRSKRPCSEYDINSLPLDKTNTELITSASEENLSSNEVEPIKSPVIGLKQRRNPFLMAGGTPLKHTMFSLLEPKNTPEKSKSTPNSPSTEEESSPSLLGKFTTKQVNKFGALNKFGRSKQTAWDKNSPVHSRYFVKTEKASKEILDKEFLHKIDFLEVPKILKDANTTTPNLIEENCEAKRNLNLTQVEDNVENIFLKTSQEMLVDKESRLLANISDNKQSNVNASSVQKSSGLSKTFKWAEFNKKFSFQASKSSSEVQRSAAVDCEFKNPFRVQTGVIKSETVDNLNEPQESCSIRLLDDASDDLAGKDDSPVSLVSGLEMDVSCSQGRRKTMKHKTCRGPGLRKGKGASDKQPNLLTLFGFQAKPKLANT